MLARLIRIKMGCIWYVYILKCSDHSFYTGSTNDLCKRVETHNSGKGAKYTRGRLPAKLVYHEECSGKSPAMQREFEIKQCTRRQKEKLIRQPKMSPSSSRDTK